ncbi:MAG: M28 family peptidase [Brumimicrobium sp.]|nr:M28 family peptidase [Brumimicrobium sp.]
MRKFFGFILLLFHVSLGLTQSYSEQYAFYINSEDLEKHIRVLASDSFQGRETGYEGQAMTTDYLIQQLRRDNMKGPTGFENMRFPFKVVEVKPSGSIRLNDKEYSYFDDFVFFNTKETFVQRDEEVIFISGNISDNDISEINLAGKLILLNAGEKEFDYEELLNETEKFMDKGATAVIYCTPFYDKLKIYFNEFAHHSSMYLKTDTLKNITPLIIGREEILNKSGLKKKWKRKLDKGKKITKIISLSPGDISLNTDTTHLETENVVAFIEGKELKDEVVVITAHMDHLGAEDGEIYNGADDNATGTAALLEIAQAFSLAKKDGHQMKRSLLIMPVSGEEKGLLGSRFYSENPIFPLSLTLANLNIDMIGRNDEFHDSSNYVYVIGSNMISDELHDINEEANRKYVGIDLDYTYNSFDDPNRYYFRSDHYNFAKHGIPSIFYFSGVHEDYHKPSDTVDKINFEKVETVTRLVFFTAWELLNHQGGLK